MNIIFENEMFKVEADSKANMYRIINKQTNVMEETGQSAYEAIRYCMLGKNAIQELLAHGDKDTSWPTVNKVDVHYN